MYDTAMYDFAFSFWSLLSTERADLPGGRALAHAEVPYLLSNAAWYPRPGELKSVAEWYAARDLPPALMVSGERDAAVERTLQEGPFKLEQSFIFRPAEPMDASQNVVEQVSWAQTRYAGDLLAKFYGQLELAVAISKSLTEIMQRNADVQTFLAYEDEPVGTMVTFEQENTLSSVLLLGSGGLEARLAQEADARGLRAFVLEPLPAGTTFRSKRGLERWSIR
ncbi:hypothetical protein BH24DEI2_BH24DEI2_16140 [soil metagenome]